LANEIVIRGMHLGSAGSNPPPLVSTAFVQQLSSCFLAQKAEAEHSGKNWDLWPV